VDWGQRLPNTEAAAEMRVPVELIGESLLLICLVTAPWIYGAVQDPVRYGLCAIVLLASGLLLWPDLRDLRLPKGLVPALALPAFGLTQVFLRQSVAPILTLEAALVGFSMAAVWAAVDARSGSTSTQCGRRLAWALLVVCLSESAFAAFQWSTDRTALFGRKNELQTMPFGSYVNHNNFAGLISLGVPLALAMAVGDVRRSGKLTARGLGLAGLSCGLAITVLASSSRGAVVGLVCGMLVLAAISGSLLSKGPRHRSWMGPFVIGFMILGAAVVAVPTPTRQRLAGVFEKSLSSEYRIDIGRASLRAFAQQPLLGSGLGAFADAATPFKSGHGDVRSERAEADLLEFAVEGGSVFLLCLLFFGGLVWRWSRDEMLYGRDRSGRWLRAGALSACVTMLFHSLFDFGFRIPSNALAFAVLLGLASAGRSQPGPGGLWISRATLGVIGLAAAGCAYHSVGSAGENEAASRTTPESRLDLLQGLVDAHPYLHQARRQRGLAWLALAYSHGNYDSSRLERARADLRAVVAGRPQWGEALADLGWIEYYAGRMSEARELLSTASRVDPTHLGVGLGYAQALAWSGDTPGALREVGRLRIANPSWARASAVAVASFWTQDPYMLSRIP
jgi:O-antigen ligase